MPFTAEEPCLSLSKRVSLKAGASVLSPDGRLGQYRIIELLGQGGMGAVYKARHVKLKRTVALKLLTDGHMGNENVARFEREMASAGQLSHPNIVVAHDAGEVDGHHYLAMELLDGVDLSKLSKARGPLPVESACELIRQAAIGLHYAHENGMVHRDVKPSNLMLTNDGTVKVLDLGLARTRGGLAENEETELTTPGQIMGTITYMAPEQCQDSAGVGAAADIYSLGASLYKLLSGVTPSSGEQLKTPMQQLAALITVDPPSISTRRSDLPKELVNLVDSMIRRDPAERPATMADVAQRLESFTGADSLGALLPGGGASQVLAPKSATAMPPTGSSESTDQRRFWFKWIGTAAFAAALMFALSQIVVSTESGDIVITTEGGVPVTITKDMVEFKDPDDGKMVRVEVDHDQKMLTLRKGGFETVTKEFSLESEDGRRIAVKFEPKVETAPVVKRTQKPGPMTKSSDQATAAMIQLMKAEGGHATSTARGLNVHFPPGHTANAGQLAQMGSHAGVNIAHLDVASAADLREFADYGQESGFKIATVRLFGKEHDVESLALVEQISPSQLVLDNTDFKSTRLTRLLQKKQWHSLVFHNQEIGQEAIQQLKNQVELKELMFTSITGLESWDMRELESLPLERLQLYHTKVSSTVFDSISKISSITTLRLAGLIRSEREIGPAIANIGELRNLNDLGFNSRYTRASDLKPLASRLNALTALHCWVKPDSLDAFEAFTRVKSLSLDFSKHEQRTDLQPLEKLKGLVVLKLSHATTEQLKRLEESLPKCRVAVDPQHGHGLRD